MPRKKTDIANFTLRLREDLRRRLVAAQRKSGNATLNSEILQRLAQSFQMEDRTAEYVNLVKDLADELLRRTPGWFEFDDVTKELDDAKGAMPRRRKGK